MRKVENKLGCHFSCPSIVVAKEYRKRSCINGINTNTVSLLLRCVHEFDVFLTVHHSIDLFQITKLMHNSFIL